jgi:hypothetical protein
MSQTTSNFSNKSFERMVKRIRKAMPTLAAVLLVTVYAVSASIAAVLLKELMTGVSGGLWIAWAMSIVIQATRATLVFFPQLNPIRPSLTKAGEWIAVVMGVISIAEIIGLVFAIGLQVPVAVSASILMLAGIGVEIFLLREIRFATGMELRANKEHWEALRDYYQAELEFKAFVNLLKDMELDERNLPNHGSTLHSAHPTPAHTGSQQGATLKDVQDAVRAAVAELAAGLTQAQQPAPAPQSKPDPEPEKPEYYKGGRDLSLREMMYLAELASNGKSVGQELSPNQINQLSNAAKSQLENFTKPAPEPEPMDVGNLGGNGSLNGKH